MQNVSKGQSFQASTDNKWLSEIETSKIETRSLTPRSMKWQRSLVTYLVSSPCARWHANGRE